MNTSELISAAAAAREKAYTPYSGFRVGAALLCKNGKVYTGCNIENASYSPTNCAERTAFFKAVSEGDREFEAIAIIGGKDELTTCYPCGVCLQVMAEFSPDKDLKVIVSENGKDYTVYTLMELLPHGFELKAD